ncbi:MAG: BBE domain-containing protein [Bdellovibrionaceae bacterium]|nr:BBE domain-containing protein [Pseudobdellovibrionaceae bacterium]
MAKRKCVTEPNGPRTIRSPQPYVSGFSYVNYCDTDISNWAHAYWGENLERLMDVKTKWDPENFFKHAQSIPARG